MNKKGWNKSGQFYLIAAIVIISIIIGFTSVANYSKKKTNEEINMLKEELQIETGQVIEYGMNTYTSPIGRLGKINLLVQNVSEDYANYTGIENQYFVIGDKIRIMVSALLKSVPENISIDGNYTLFKPTLKNYTAIYYSPVGGKLTIGIDEIPYQFELSDGMNIQFIISKGDYVATNKI